MMTEARRGTKRKKDAGRKELALESLFVYCIRTKRTRRPRRESSEFNVVEQVMMWWLGNDEWTCCSQGEQERQLRSVTQWWNHRKRKGKRHRLVDAEELEARVSILLQLNTSKGIALETPQFRGTADSWAKALGLESTASAEASSGLLPRRQRSSLLLQSPHEPVSRSLPLARHHDPPTLARLIPTQVAHKVHGCEREHTAHCGHKPVKVLSNQGVASIGFIVNRASCCESSGNLFCDVHSGTADGPVVEHSMVSHGDHIDYVIDGCLTHPMESDDGSMRWHQCGELVPMDDDTLNDLVNLLA